MLFTINLGFTMQFVDIGLLPFDFYTDNTYIHH